MPTTLTWSDEYATGIDIIDEQHKRLFAYFEEIQQCINADDEARVEGICRNLIEYAITHNTFEESLMEKAGYPMLEQHHQIHEAFKKRAYGYLQQIQEGAVKMKVARNVRTDIGLWLINHIKREDQHYVPYVKADLDQGFVGRMVKRFFG